MEGGSLRWKPNTRKELSKATEKGERLGFFEELRNPKRPLPCVGGVKAPSVTQEQAVAGHWHEKFPSEKVTAYMSASTLSFFFSSFLLIVTAMTDAL